VDEVSLNTLLPGQRGTVERIESTAGGVRQRLMEMGLVRGTVVELIRFAPLGDPMEVRLRGYRLSIRKDEAEAIILRKVGR
jgi:ferrous iron transport protein A